MDETDFWAEAAANGVQAEVSMTAVHEVRPERRAPAAPESVATSIPAIQVERAEWDLCDLHDLSLNPPNEECQKTEPTTPATVFNPRAKMADPDVQRRLFNNLHKQLKSEVEKAQACGSWELLDPGMWSQAEVYARKPSFVCEDLERRLAEVDVRVMVGRLIIARQSVELQ